MSRICVLGEAFIEYEIMGEIGVRTNVGGACMHIAAHVRSNAAADVLVQVATGLGVDDNSERVRRHADRLGLDLSVSATTHSGVNIFWVETDGRDRWARLSPMASSAAAFYSKDVQLGAFGPGDTLVVTGVSLAIASQAGQASIAEALESARDGGATTILATTYRSHLWAAFDPTPSLEAALRHTDVVMSSETDTMAIWANDEAAFTGHALDAGATEVIMNGRDHATVTTATSIETARARPLQPEAVDPAETKLFGAYIARRNAGDAVADALTTAIGHAERRVA